MNYGTCQQRKAKSLSGINNPKYGKGKKVRCIETNQIFDCIPDANEFLGKDRCNSNIKECCRGKNKTAYGLHWEYIDKDK